jgi:peptidoglycan/LPS O-acetylase OafA/YrhL
VNQATLKNYSNFDYLRAISAVVVFISHLFQIFWMPVVGSDHPLSHLMHHASVVAVLIFFVLSGYVIALSLNRNLEINNGKFRETEYFVSRIVRIYPPFIFSILLVVFIYIIVNVLELPGTTSPLSSPMDVYQAREYFILNYKEIFTAFALLNGLEQMNGPLWSLYIEVRMYIFAGLLVLIINSSWGSFKQISSTLLFLVLAKFFIQNPVTIHYASWWLIGSAFFIGYESTRPHVKLISAISIAILFATIIFSTQEKVSDTILAFFFIFTVFVIAINTRWRLGSFMKNIANYSYSLYIVHFPITLFVYSLYLLFIDTHGIYMRLIFSVIPFFIVMQFSKLVASRLEDTKAFKRVFYGIFKKKIQPL